ncbi:MAG: PD-(D/E)XK nuclease domain-containing protein, partial [Trichlorobacter sp.]|nr:PD-(D/E)XK nuclease domain-containing protein [Trichlorobacter sp.]
DMTVKLNEHTWLFEFKVVELVPKGKAIEQLRERNYAQKYLGSGSVHLVGVEFSKDERNIVGFDTQTM